jgi:hypothetical protein
MTAASRGEQPERHRLAFSIAMVLVAYRVGLHERTSRKRPAHRRVIATEAAAITAAQVLTIVHV